MRKTLRRTAVWGLCWLLLIAGEAWAQTVPGAPTITTVAAGHSSSLGLTLAVTWTAPADIGGSAIEAYDVGYIETADDETDDANWTVEEGDGALSYTISGLTDSTEYDVQVRAINANGDGAWSATETGTTSDHGDSASEATSLVLDTDTEGVIDPGTDVDYFTFRLTRETGIRIWTTGDLDTVGELQNSSGTVIDSDDDGPFSSAPLSFFMWQTLARGTYRIKVSSYGEATGSYVLRTRTMVDTSSISNAQEITFNSAGNGTRSGLIDPGGDTDYFKIELSEATDLVIRTTGLVGDTVGILLNRDGTEILAFNDDGFLWPSLFRFLIRTRLDAGTYYILVSGFDEDDTGFYTLHVNKANEPGNTRATAVSLDLGIAEGSRIDPSSDEDYFRLDITETTNIIVGAVSETVDIDGELLNADGNAVDTNLYGIGFGDGPSTFFLHDHLDAGTYYIRVTQDADDTNTGPYTIRAFEVAGYNNFLDRCADIDDTVSDPLYGCQWHLNNTGQLKGGTAGEDINVEEVWDDNNLGAGINVAVVDDGMDYTHEDLSANVDTTRNHDYTGRNDIFHPLEDHGTAVAGIIAAQNNSLGVRGVAPQAKIYGYNLLLDSTDANEADAAKRDLDATAISSNSWGPYDGPGLDAAPGIWELAVEKGITEGFDDKGIFYAWAAGNGGDYGDNSNLDGYANHYGVTAVCAVNDQGERSAYSEEGANLWVCAPSNDRTRDRHGITTIDNDDFYRNSFGGTSAATPIVSGVVALIRKANSNLTWRDVKLILAASARQNDPDNTGWEDGTLKYGSDTERYHFNHEYGFGVVDAKAAVDLADGWTKLPTLTEASAYSAPFTGGYMIIPDSRTWVTNSLTLGSDVEFTEFVEINANFGHLSFRDLQVELVSPSGKVSVLSVPYDPPRSGVYRATYGLEGSFRFGSAKHLGENPAGTWTLRLSDRVSAGNPGRLYSWSLTVYGHRSTPGAPDIDEVTPGIGSLTVTWKEPTNTGASAVTGYDVRYIKTTEDETDDDNWTEVDTGWTSGGALQHIIPGLDDDAAYDIQVRAVNDQGDGAWSYTATETPSGDAPYFSEGTDTTRSVDENATAGTNVGSPVEATDLNDPTLTYTLSGTDAGSFDIDDSTGQLTVALGTALDHETKDSYAVTVTATDPVTTTDPSPDSDSIAVTIEVTDVDESPTLTGKDSVSHAENSILPVAEYKAADPEGESLTWSLAGTDDDDFTISNGVLSFDSAPDYEDPNHNNVYEVTVVASDETTSSATLPVTVTVTNVDEVHTLTELSRVSSYAENGTGSVAEYTVTDPESVSPTWSLAGADHGDFTITGGVLSFTNSPDFEQPADAGGNNVYEVTVQATAGIHTIPQTVIIRVTPVDEPPTLMGPTSVLPYDENRTTRVATFTATDPEGKTVLWSVTGADAFDISNGGVLTFKSPPDYEAADSHTVTVQASDGTTDPATQALTVTINNLDEAGSLTLSSEYPQVDAELTATLTDPDGVSGPIWLWERRSSNSGTWTEIDDETSNSYTPVTDDMNNYLRARVVYTDGHGELGSKSFQREATNRVRAARGNNNVPLFSDATTTRSVQENTAAGRNIGDPIVATDADTDDPLTYSLDAAGDSVFAIDSRSGQLRTKAELDREKTSSYAVTVTATDPSGDSASIDVTITVENEDEPLTLMGPSAVPYAENDTGPVDTFSADDPEHEHDPITWPITWALTGVDRNSLTLTANITDATLTFNDPPDYEADTRYTVTVEASAGSHTARQTVTVNVTDVNERPTITRPADTDIPYTEHATGPVATYRATDPERDPIQWTVDSAAFTISDGVLRFRTPPDHETKDSYSVTVTASDDEFTDELDVTVTVTNEDEAGSLTLSSVQPQVDTELTAILTDPDGLVSIDWVWEQSQDNKRTWEPVKGTPAASYTPETADVGAYLRVTVTYTDGAGADKHVPPIVAPYAVRQARVNNDPPAFTEPTATLTIGANARAGSSVGTPVRAEDPGDPLTYTLDETESAAACFDIDWLSGQIAVGPQGVAPCANSATRSPGQRTISTKADEPKTYQLTVLATDPSGESADIPVFITVSSAPPPPPPPPPPSPPPPPPRGGGGPVCADDGHANTAAQATGIALDAETPGAICPAADVDYFTVTAPDRGVVFVDTFGGVQTRGTIWQDGEVLASGSTGRQQNDRLGVLVQAGPVVVAVQGQGGATGTYDLEITFVQGYLENPGADSFQSGVGVLSGWVCEAEVVEIELNGIPQEAAYGTERLDTLRACGDTDNGFGLLFNWNLLRDGEHEVVALVDGVELGRATVTVTTLGQEFLRDVTGTCEAEDFPTLGERVTLVWQQNSQNFVIAGGSPPAGATTGRTSGLTGFLENPGHNSFQSGVRVLSGWVCDADTVELAIGTAGRQVAAYGTERLDTQGACGDTDNGFGLLFNWNLLGEGEHEVVAYVDDVELGRATVQVTTLGQEFLRGVEGECMAEDFPRLGEMVTLEWQQNSQNFVITDVQ